MNRSEDLQRNSLFVIRAALVGAAIGTLLAILLERGLPRLSAALVCATTTACYAIATRNREAGLVRRLVALENESLELRRTVFHLKKGSRGPSDETVMPGGRDSREALLAATVLAISSELNETRVLESAARGVLASTGAREVAIFPHDRRTDRFVRGFVARAAESPAGGFDVLAAVPTATEEPAMRTALRRRQRVGSHDGDSTSKAAFDVAGGDLVAVAPLYDRAITCGVVVVRGEVEPLRLAALDGIAAATSLALTNARLRSSVASHDEARADLPTKGKADLHA